LLKNVLIQSIVYKQTIFQDKMKRICFITGYYGSGKSEISVNLALREKVDYLIDLDIINPYFRSREVNTLLEAANIEMISSDSRDAKYSDMPYISGRVFLPFLHKNTTAIYDLGGNDLGAKLLKQFDFKEQVIDLWMVINIYRPDTNTVDKILRLIEEIEFSSGKKITGLINNTNLIHETTEDVILEGDLLLREVSKNTSIPIILTVVEEHVTVTKNQFSGNLLPLKLYLRKNWFEGGNYGKR